MENINIEFKKIIESPYCVKAFLSEDNKFLQIETKNGTVLSICPHHQGYQVNLPIHPNRKTGSSIGLTGDYWDYATLDQVLNWVQSANKFYPNFFSQSDIESVKFQTIEQSLEHYKSFNYKQIK